MGEPSPISKKEKKRQQQKAAAAAKKAASDANPKKPDENTPTKSKAELKAERRAIQEAQRANKAKAGSKKPGNDGGAKQKPHPEKEASLKPKPLQEARDGGQSQTEKSRVPYSLQMDDEKVQKKVAKKLAKQQVPQRTVHQKKVDLFSHLHQYEKDKSLTKEILVSSSTLHPAIVRLGLQYADGIVTGSNARCIALLAAMKQVINDYVTPPSKELSRDLEAKLKPYISFLTQCRPMSVSMGNAVKYLKLQISRSPPGMSESEAKQDLLDGIDSFLEERIYVAGRVISDSVSERINDGDVVLVYGFSSLVIKILKKAFGSKKFRVVVVDSRPRFEGRQSLKRLIEAGISCSYVLINAVSFIMKEVTTVILGAHALLANGYVMSRTGSSVVAMTAKANNVPVLVCCETYKFCERVQTDAFVFNELGDPDDLVSTQKLSNISHLQGWRDIKSLYLLNLIYDVTPSNFVDMVITEIGMIPCTSVPVVLRVKNREQ